MSARTPPPFGILPSKRGDVDAPTPTSLGEPIGPGLRHYRRETRGNFLEERAFSDEQVAAVERQLYRDWIAAENSTKKHVRAGARTRRAVWLIWRICAEVGIRDSEARELVYDPPWGWEMEPDGSLRIWVEAKKRSISRNLWLSPGLAADVDAHRVAYGIEPSDHMFTTSKGKVISSSDINRMIRGRDMPGGREPGALERCGVPLRERVLLHGLRHRVALETLEVTDSLTSVQDLLGHTQRQTTETYVQRSIRRRDKSIRATLQTLRASDAQAHRPSETATP